MGCDSSKITLSDKSVVRVKDFNLESAKQRYDPLGRIFKGLKQSTLVSNLDIPVAILSLIISCCNWTESTIREVAYYETITSSPTKNFSECCLLINPPINTQLNYIIKSLKFRCGYFEVAPKSYWPDNAKVYFQIELFDGKNHIKDNSVDKSDYNVLWKSKEITCGKVMEKIQIKNINVKLETGKTYLLWVECISEPFHALYTKYDPHFKNKKAMMIHEQLKHTLIREVKLCDNRWFLRNVSKIWEITFNANINASIVNKQNEYKD